MEEIDVAEGCEAAGRTIGEVRGTTMVAAVRSTDGQVHPQPGSDTVLRPGDVLVAMGTTEALKKLESLFVPKPAGATGSVLGDLG
jgi:K+/H+ antiporter YhaU regulatory subunit KhtT